MRKVFVFFYLTFFLCDYDHGSKPIKTLCEWTSDYYCKHDLCHVVSEDNHKTDNHSLFAGFNSEHFFSPHALTHRKFSWPFVQSGQNHSHQSICTWSVRAILGLQKRRVQWCKYLTTVSMGSLEGSLLSPPPPPSFPLLSSPTLLFKYLGLRGHLLSYIFHWVETDSSSRCLLCLL